MNRTSIFSILAIISFIFKAQSIQGPQDQLLEIVHEHMHNLTAQINTQSSENKLNINEIEKLKQIVTYVLNGQYNDNLINLKSAIKNDSKVLNNYYFAQLFQSALTSKIIRKERMNKQSLTFYPIPKVEFITTEYLPNSYKIEGNSMLVQLEPDLNNFEHITLFQKRIFAKTIGDFGSFNEWYDIYADAPYVDPNLPSTIKPGQSASYAAGQYVRFLPSPSAMSDINKIKEECKSYCQEHKYTELHHYVLKMTDEVMQTLENIKADTLITKLITSIYGEDGTIINEDQHDFLFDNISFLKNAFKTPGPTSDFKFPQLALIAYRKAQEQSQILPYELIKTAIKAIMEPNTELTDQEKQNITEYKKKINQYRHILQHPSTLYNFPVYFKIMHEVLLYLPYRYREFLAPDCDAYSKFISMNQLHDGTSANLYHTFTKENKFVQLIQKYHSDLDLTNILTLFADDFIPTHAKSTSVKAPTFEEFSLDRWIVSVQWCQVIQKVLFKIIQNYNNQNYSEQVKLELNNYLKKYYEDDKGDRYYRDMLRNLFIMDLDSIIRHNNIPNIAECKQKLYAALDLDLNKYKQVIDDCNKVKKTIYKDQTV